MAAPRPRPLALTLPAELYDALAAAAAASGQSADSLAVEAIRDRLETSLRYRVLIERLGTVDQALIDLAALVGETAAASDALADGEDDLASICRYRAPQSS